MSIHGYGDEQLRICRCVRLTGSGSVSAGSVGSVSAEGVAQRCKKNLREDQRRQEKIRLVEGEYCASTVLVESRW